MSHQLQACVWLTETNENLLAECLFVADDRNRFTAAVGRIHRIQNCVHRLWVEQTQLHQIWIGLHWLDTLIDEYLIYLFNSFGRLTRNFSSLLRAGLLWRIAVIRAQSLAKWSNQRVNDKIIAAAMIIILRFD